MVDVHLLVDSSSKKVSIVLNSEKQVQEARQYWDNIAPSFDDGPDHGLRDPLILASWTDFLQTCLPYTDATILDVGCGTGSLSIVLARLGHKVTGIDVSPAMIAIAQTKAATHGFQIEFHIGDAAFLQALHKQFDVIICRHLLWALPEPKHVLQRWADLLKPKGRLILIEGFWETGSGLHASEITKMLPPSFATISVYNLGGNPNFWDKDVTDERYAIMADIDH